MKHKQKVRKGQIVSKLHRHNTRNNHSYDIFIEDQLLVGTIFIF